jgi:Dolichyl-phosphate-mannose-protein mannosyltransferase
MGVAVSPGKGIMDQSVSHRTTAKKIAVTVRGVLLCTAVYFIVMYITTSLLRMVYPYELDWMEGGLVDHVMRVLSGKPLYVKPTIDFIPFIYTPFYYYVSALAAKLTGPGFLPLRLVSFLASLVNFYLIYYLVHRETRSGFAGLLSAAVFTATNAINGTWFDICRTDSLYMTLLLSAVVMLRFSESVRGHIAAGLILSVGMFTKQTVLLAALPVIFYCVIIHWRRSLALIAAMIGLTGSLTWIMTHLTDGWYLYYTVRLPRYHQIHAVQMFRLKTFWTSDMILYLIPALVLTGLFLIHITIHFNKRRSLFYLVFTTGMIYVSWTLWLNNAAFNNVFIPTHAALAICFGMSWHTFKADAGKGRHAREIIVGLACLCQFACLVYNPATIVPTKRDRLAGEELIQKMQKMQGEVLIMTHGYLPVMAGKAPHAHKMAITDISRGIRDADRQTLLSEISRKIMRKQFDTIILDSSFILFRPEIEHYYRFKEYVFEDLDVFWPVIGMQTRPEMICVPAESPPPNNWIRTKRKKYMKDESPIINRLLVPKRRNR